MRVLVIGGTGFIGSFIATQLASAGHGVTVYHPNPGRSSLPQPIRHVYGDRESLPQRRADFQKLAPDVVVDCILSSGRQARTLMETMCGITGRVVALSSQDVYRACGIVHSLEVGPLQPLPITEDSDLRTRPGPYPPHLLQSLRAVFPWVDDEYDKIPVEHELLNHPELPATILRLPMVYGPGDPLHRLFPIVKRIDDRRPVILIQEDAAAWRGPRGYVENVAAGIAVAVTSPQAAGRIYNLGEPKAFSELEWTTKVCEAAGYRGRVRTIPKDRTPAHLRVPFRTDQHWVVSTRRIREDLGFVEPVGLDFALKRSIDWERTNPPSIHPAQFQFPVRGGGRRHGRCHGLSGDSCDLRCPLHSNIVVAEESPHT
jgi:nucleoside-diphosphate-sugar epimerase